MASVNVLKTKNYALLFWGDFISSVGSVFFNLAVSFYILEITGNNAMIQGAYLALAGVVNLILTPLGGVMADKYNKAKIISVTDLICGVIVLLTAVFLKVFSSDITARLIVLFITCAGLNVNTALSNPSNGTLVRFIVRDDQLQQANAYFSMSQSIRGVIGILCAGVFYGAFGIIWVCIFDGVSFIISAVMEMFIKYDYKKTETSLSVKTFAAEFSEGIKSLWGKKQIVSFLLIALGLNLFINPFFANGMPYFCNSQLRGDYLFSGFIAKEMWFAVFSVAVSLGMLAVSVIMGRAKPKDNIGRSLKIRVGIMALVLVANAVCYYFLVERGGGLNAYIISVVAGAVVLGGVMAAINIPIGVAMMTIIEKDQLGKVTSISSVLTQALIPLGSLAAGAIISGMGLTSLFIICAVGFVAMTIYAIFSKGVNDL